MAVHDEYFQATIERDFFHFMCGDLLGAGAYRNVYVFAPDPRFVIKIETGAQSFSNIREWDLWHDAQHMGKEVSDWLAPCVAISACGTVLRQRRTLPAKTFPDKIPVWMTDTKRQNFGLIGSRFVAHDYGNHLVCNSGLSTRLRKADWWGDV